MHSAGNIPCATKFKSTVKEHPGMHPNAKPGDGGLTKVGLTFLTQQVWRRTLQRWGCAPWHLFHPFCHALQGTLCPHGHRQGSMVASVPLGLMSEFQAGARAGGPKSAGLSLFIWEGSPPPGYCADIPWDRTLSVAMLAARESEKARFF